MAQNTRISKQKQVVYPKSYNKIWQFKGFWDYYPEFVKEQSFELFKQSQNPIGPKYNIQKIQQNKINNQEDEEEKIQETIQNSKFQQKQPEIQSEQEQKIDKNEEQQCNLIEQLVKEEIKEISNIQNYENENNQINNNNQKLVFQDQDEIQQNIQKDQQENFENNSGSDQEIPEEEEQQQFEQNQNQLDHSQEFQKSEKSQKISNYLVQKQQENFNQINEIAQEDKISVYQFKTSKSEGFKSLKNSFVLERQIDSIKKIKQTQSQKKPQISDTQKFKKSKSSIDLSFNLENLQNQLQEKPQNQQFQEQTESTKNLDPNENNQNKKQTSTNEQNNQTENQNLAKSENITQNIINVQNQQNQQNSSFFGKLSLGFKSTIQQVQSANNYVGESFYSQMDSIYSYVKSFSQLDQEIQRLQNQLGIEFYGQYFNQNQNEVKNLEQEKQAKQESFQGKQNKNSQTPKQVYKKMMEEFFNQELKTEDKTEIKKQKSMEVENQSKSEQNLENKQSCSLTKVETPKQRRKISFEIAEPSKYNSNNKKQEDQNQNKQQTTAIPVKQNSLQNKNQDKKNEKSQIEQKQEQKNDNIQTIQNPFKAVLKQQFFSLNQIENASQEQILLYISYLHIIIMINEQIGNEILLNCHMLSGLKDENLYIRNKNIFNLNAHQEKIFHLIYENYTNLERISYQILLNFSFVLARFQNQTLLQINLQSQSSLQDSSGNENDNTNLNSSKNLLSKKQQQLFKQLYAKSLELIVYLVGDYRNEKFLFNNFLPELLKIEIDFFQVNFKDVSSTLFSLNQKNYPNIKKISNSNNNQQPVEKKKNIKKNSVEIQNQLDQNKDKQILNEKINLESQKQQNIQEIQNDKDQQNSKTVQINEDENKKISNTTQENNKQQNQQQNNEKNIWLDFYNDQKT
ncbi:hypothetical protein PPERSA_03752 [Pseudocohnilembus persalinus]|uniref:Uncharacterized protein n=1 Tax=Pseudocohnilembus persalinus TaxID=266149 RepID=A0A0V0Q8C8_PSEPJ|nr:hypothetical protein PPERSA_03752 [Pseudocohnilembus persalinus]|eukprot:KRW98415.1 hypothetical protein PPERSA_03752 [Pseudocohnilembus persalinus]